MSFILGKLKSVNIALIFCLATSSAAHGQEADSTIFPDLLQMPLEKLLELNITTASRISEKLSDVPASSIVITRDEILIYGYTSIEEVLSNIPGLYAIDNYYWLGGVGYGVRGFYSDGHFKEMIIMVNGVNQAEGYTNSFQLGKLNVPIEAIDRIEVVRGPMAVTYGNGAFFGAINIITNQTQNPVSVASAQYGSLETYKTALKVTGEEGKIKYALNAGVFETQGLDVKWKDMVSDPSIISKPFDKGGWGLPSNDASSKGQLTDQKRYFNFSGNYKHFSCDITYANSHKGVIDGFPGVGIGTSIEQVFTNGTIQYKRDFSKRFGAKVSVGLFGFNSYQEYNYLANNNYGVNVLKNLYYELEAETFIRPTKNFDIVAGIYRRTVYKADVLLDIPLFQLHNFTSYLPPGQRVNTNAFFTQLNLKLLEKFKFCAGIRLENVGKYDRQLTGGPITYPTDSLQVNERLTFGNEKIYSSYRAALVYSINAMHNLKFIYGTAIQQPSIADNSSKLLENSRVDLLIALEPAQIQTIELNYNFLFLSQLVMNLSVFNNKLDKLLIRDNLFENGQYVLITRNAGKQETIGAEMNLKVKPLEKFLIDLSVSYQDSRNTVDSLNPLAYAPKFLGYGKVSYRLINKFVFSVSYRYVDAMLSGLDPSTGKRIGEKVSDYSIFDTHIRWDNIYKGLYAGACVKNILNQEVRYPTTRNSTWADKGTIGYPRMLLLNVGYKF